MTPLGVVESVAAVSAEPAATSAIELIGITKAFPGVVANDDVSLRISCGEVHCLLGENGAGKSTLMNVLSGMYQADSGQIKIDDQVVEIDSPKRALELGIGTVYQHSTLIPVMTVIENLMLGMGSGVRLPLKTSLAGLQKLASSLGIEVDPFAVTGRLALGQQQQIEIVKALWHGSKFLILDEPTSMLTPQGIAELGELIKQLKAQGLAIVFITHKLREALDLGDRISILRRGRLVAALGPDELRAGSREEIQGKIIGLMFGQEKAQLADVAEIRDELTGRRGRQLKTAPILEIEGVSVEPRRGEVGVHDVSLAVKTGEIMGVAGVDGNGQRELAEAIAGQRHIAGGHIKFLGHPITHLSVAKRQQLGLRYVTDDRLGEGIVSSVDVATNLVLKRIGQRPFWRSGGRVCTPVIQETARELVEEFDIRTPSVTTDCGTLSGGNLQKVVLARELSFGPKFVVYNKPTYGLDVKTTMAVRERIRKIAEKDEVAALLISTDLEELLDVCDRIAVLFRGKITGVVDNRPGAAEEIGRLMIGGGE